MNIGSDNSLVSKFFLFLLVNVTSILNVVNKTVNIFLLNIRRIIKYNQQVYQVKRK